MNTFDAVSGSDLPTAIEVWMGREDAGADHDRLIGGLFAVCVNLANELREDSPTRPGMDAMDLAHEFLVAARHEGLGGIEKKAGLRTAFRRHVWRSQNPASDELWETLSESLRELARQGHACRVGANWSAPNSNDAQWAAGPATGVPQATDMVVFEECAEKLRHYYPPGALGAAGKKVPKIISPTDARELAASLLDCAPGWVTMRELFAAFRKHVHLLSVDVSIDDGNNPGFLNEEDRRHPDTELKLLELARARAGTLWETLRQKTLCEVLCGYVLPKVLEGKKVTLEALGKHSVVFDKKEKIMRLLAEELRPEAFAEDEAVTAHHSWHAVFVALVASELAARCDECTGKRENSSLPSPVTI
ncbi:hypothetical protein GCM10023213_39090 [Prosthecobacter algae]|uniref:Uncharacterized protein n=1 Tax=Prosthecobacter algae TaxID=1144682 RepID=A0ABP9PGR0_9BACT